MSNTFFTEIILGRVGANASLKNESNGSHAEGRNRLLQVVSGSSFSVLCEP